MLSTADFLQYAQWSGIATLVFAALTILGFILKWGIRFRLVGTTGFNSPGRLGSANNNLLTIRARTILHPEPGLSIPFYLGQVRRSLTSREDPQMAVEVDLDKFAELPKSQA
jgi:hypothetical protein